MVWYNEKIILLHTIMFLENHLFDDQEKLSEKERDMHMFELKNHMVSMVEEKTIENDTVCEILSNGSSSKYGSIFSKEDGMYSIGLEREFYIEYIVCEKRKLDVKYVAIAKQNGKEGKELTYGESPEKVFNCSLRFLSTFCEQE